jgi:hypothetical protein
MQEVLQPTIDKLKPGTTWRVLGQARIHILAIVDDDQIVYRVWSKSKRCWMYKVEWAYLFWLYDQDNKLTYVGKSQARREAVRKGMP